MNWTFLQLTHSFQHFVVSDDFRRYSQLNVLHAYRPTNWPPTPLLATFIWTDTVLGLLWQPEIFTHRQAGKPLQYHSLHLHTVYVRIDAVDFRWRLPLCLLFLWDNIDHNSLKLPNSHHVSSDLLTSYCVGWLVLLCHGETCYIEDTKIMLRFILTSYPFFHILIYENRNLELNLCKIIKEPWEWNTP